MHQDHDSGIESSNKRAGNDTVPEEPIKKRRISQEAFEFMMRAKDIFSEAIPAKKMLAKIRNSKCKMYIDTKGQCNIMCNIITTACGNTEGELHPPILLKLHNIVYFCA